MPITTRASARFARALIAASLIAASLPLATAAPALAQDWRTSSSLVEPTKYPPDFKHFDYVNPGAPKGGTLNSTIASSTFDSFNPYIVRGTAAAGLAPFGGGLLYETLMTQSLDEPGVSHALIADAFKFPDDFSSATYRLNPAAKWHDGQPITVEDVIWSFEKLKELSPGYNRYFHNVTGAAKSADREVTFTFDQKGNRELPHIMGDLVVLPKHWWEGKDTAGKQRDVSRPTLEPPLGSGPYRIASFKPGSEIVWERVPDAWARDLSVNVGRYNFALRRYIYIQDMNAEWQAFTKGGFEDIRPEASSRFWATQYTFPAVEAGDVVKKEFKTTNGEPMQGFVMNLRRPQFQNRDVRHALTLALNFEEMNRTQFFGLNTRTSSYFQGTELASSGLPQVAELTILEALRDKLPPELFTQEFKLPVYDTPQSERTILREAVALFAKGGWRIDGGRLVDAGGTQMRIEILGNNPQDEIISGSFVATLRRLGIDASLRIVDASQYVNRVRAFDYDMVTSSFSQSLSPGNEQRDFWGSAAADAPGSRNLMGIKDPVVDALVDRVIFAADRADLVAATHALDRVLLWNYYVVPQWHRPVIWLAIWNKFGIPEKQPSYVGADTESWWIDAEREKALAAKYGLAP